MTSILYKKIHVRDNDRNRCKELATEKENACGFENKLTFIIQRQELSN